MGAYNILYEFYMFWGLKIIQIKLIFVTKRYFDPSN